ncbi:MAG: type II toxin-antitoxin system HigB family toxin [Blastocatellia bacterium]
MRIITKKMLREFWERYPDAKKPLMERYDITEQATWRNFADVRNTFRPADSYCDCVIFDIKGNDYRLIAIILYQAQRVYTRHALTHKEYDEGAWKDDCSC